LLVTALEQANKKAFRMRALILGFFGFSLAFLTIWFCHSKGESSPAFSATLLTIVAFCFILGGGWVISEQNHPDGGPPPWIIIGAAIALEAFKVILLLKLPVSRGTLSSSSSIFYSNAALSIAAATALMTFALASFVGMSLDAPKADEWSDPVRVILNNFTDTVAWLQRRRVTALCMTFASFILVTYFLAFAVGFDDRNADRPAFYSPVTKSSVPLATKSTLDASDGTVISVEPTYLNYKPMTSAPVLGENNLVKFAFARGTADIQETLDSWPKIEPGCLKAGRNAQEITAQLTVTDPARARVLKRDPRRIVLRNIEALCQAMPWFESATIAGQRQRILIFGHANRGQVDTERDSTNDARPPYRSDAELANTRAQVVFLALNQLMISAQKRSRHSIADLLQWQIGAGASETAMLSTSPLDDDWWTPDPQLSESDARISVEVEREVLPPVVTERHDITLRLLSQSLVTGTKPKPAPRGELLDYVYFMIYTITTTGYGDFMPITPRTKFIVSIANLAEVTYLAMIFMLISTKRDVCRECEGREKRLRERRARQHPFAGKEQ
jgi:hypothetical protein